MFSSFREGWEIGMKQGYWATFPDGLTTAPGASPVLQSQGKAETAAVR